MITGLDYPLKNVQKGRRGLNKYIWGATFHGMKANELSVRIIFRFIINKSYVFSSHSFHTPFKRGYITKQNG